MSNAVTDPGMPSGYVRGCAMGVEEALSQDAELTRSDRVHVLVLALGGQCVKSDNAGEAITIAMKKLAALHAIVTGKSQTLVFKQEG